MSSSSKKKMMKKKTRTTTATTTTTTTKKKKKKKKKKKGTKRLKLSRTLDSLSSVYLEFYNIFNEREKNNMAGIMRNTGQHFLGSQEFYNCFQVQRKRRVGQHGWNYQKLWTTVQLSQEL